jgi:hypothetical protein
MHITQESERLLFVVARGAVQTSLMRRIIAYEMSLRGSVISHLLLSQFDLFCLEFKISSNFF